MLNSESSPFLIKHRAWAALAFAIFCALCSFGAMELIQKLWLIRIRNIDPGNCPHVLYDLKQSWISGCAALSGGLWLYFRVFPRPLYARMMGTFKISYGALLIYGARVIVYVWTFSECSALYSPGDKFGIVPLPFHYFLGGLALLMEMWAIALIFTLALELIRLVLRLDRHEPTRPPSEE